MRSVCTHMWTLSGNGLPEDDSGTDEAGGTAKVEGAAKAKGKAKARGKAKAKGKAKATGKRKLDTPDSGDTTPQKIRKNRLTSTPETGQKLPAAGQLLLGCSKCRFSKSGCARCKKAVGLGKANEQLETPHTGTGVRS